MVLIKVNQFHYSGRLYYVNTIYCLHSGNGESYPLVSLSLKVSLVRMTQWQPFQNEMCSAFTVTVLL